MGRSCPAWPQPRANRRSASPAQARRNGRTVHSRKRRRPRLCASPAKRPSSGMRWPLRGRGGALSRDDPDIVHLSRIFCRARREKYFLDVFPTNSMRAISRPVQVCGGFVEATPIKSVKFGLCGGEAGFQLSGLPDYGGIPIVRNERRNTETRHMGRFEQIGSERFSGTRAGQDGLRDLPGPDRSPAPRRQTAQGLWRRHSGGRLALRARTLRRRSGLQLSGLPDYGGIPIVGNERRNTETRHMGRFEQIGSEKVLRNPCRTGWASRSTRPRPVSGTATPNRSRALAPAFWRSSRASMATLSGPFIGPFRGGGLCSACLSEEGQTWRRDAQARTRPGPAQVTGGRAALPGHPWRRLEG